MSRSRIASFVLVSAVFMVAVAACGGASSEGGADPQAAATGFVSSVREGDGAGACSFLAEAEKATLVVSAAEVTPKLDTASCESVVESFHAAVSSKVDLLQGDLQNVSESGDFATSTWVWGGGNGEQQVLLAKKDGKWLLASGGSDFPTAVLHFFDQG